jgi:CDP-2,3-bis-(O-geranylgeranyl)-sn-glycerol synthase
MLGTIVIALWLMLPAYLPNPCAALFGGGKPIDGGRTLSDGKRILGDGKTFRGFAAGSVCGILAGMLMFLAGDLTIAGIALPAFGTSVSSAFVVVASMALGSLLGDMAMSFVKRRIGMERGAPLPGVDQLDFVAGAWLLTLLTSGSWFLENFTFYVILAVVVITPLLHITVNVVGYLAGIKKEPW